MNEYQEQRFSEEELQEGAKILENAITTKFLAAKNHTEANYRAMLDYLIKNLDTSVAINDIVSAGNLGRVFPIKDGGPTDKRVAFTKAFTENNHDKSSSVHFLKKNDTGFTLNTEWLKKEIEASIKSKEVFEFSKKTYFYSDNKTTYTPFTFRSLHPVNDKNSQEKRGTKRKLKRGNTATPKNVHSCENTFYFISSKKRLKK